MLVPVAGSQQVHIGVENDFFRQIRRPGAFVPDLDKLEKAFAAHDIDFERDSSIQRKADLRQ